MKFTNPITKMINIIYNRWLYRLVNITFRMVVKKFFRLFDHKFGVAVEVFPNLASKVVAGRF